ncbi:ABC transporter ATP-binding protein [Sporosarcina sp. FSL W7-1349]|uniref:ABC transporter ATP-binding protein n=1 Tax=Sporosarcina sp. FSL W7-1349 TaxID=2921561 RepID=UPI0030FAA1EF
MTLKIENITKKYSDKFVLKQVSCELYEGIYGLLGPNGAGKSTLMRILVDVLQSTSGRITYNGADISTLGESYRDVLGYLPQSFGGYSNFTAEKFLHYVAALKGLEGKEAIVKVDELLDLVGLQDVKKKKLRGFSGGMIQRVGIAQALINDPKVLILDEPTAGLDPSERIRFRGILSELSQDKIIILSTHIVSDIEYVANEVLLLKAGELIEKKSPTELLSELEGNVWSMIVEEKAYLKTKHRLKLVNTHHLQGKVEVRVISNDKPGDNAIAVLPRMEDIYVYYFGEND